MLLHQGSSPSEMSFIGETCFHKGMTVAHTKADLLDHAISAIPDSIAARDLGLEITNFVSHA